MLYLNHGVATPIATPFNIILDSYSCDSLVTISKIYIIIQKNVIN